MPKVYDCHAGKKYPDDAVYVGREVRDRRTGKIIRAGTVFGNHLRFSGDTFRRYALARMMNKDFAATVESLRGKDLLCWCKPDAEFCHAKVWLELANQKAEAV
jgi:hypothetical protein